MALLRVKDLAFAYPQPDERDMEDEARVLDGISFEVNEGEMLLVCGRSGCGKTTLLRLLKPLIAPAGDLSGDIELSGEPVSAMDAKDQARSIGFVMQDATAQICTDKVITELAFGLENLGVDPDEMNSRVAEVALFFGMQSILHSRTMDLSGGQKQLLNLASVVAMRPRLLILDEPMAQLDPISKETFLNMVVRLNKELGITVIISEHYLDGVMGVSDRVMFLDGGRVASIGAPGEVARNVFSALPEYTPMLPASAEIFLNVEATGGEACAEQVDVPLSVKSARAWLSRYVFEHGVRSEDAHAEDASKLQCGETEQCALIAKDVWFRYDKSTPDVLRSCSLDIPQGQITAFLGGNGSGKSTLLKVLSGRAKPYMGKVLLGDACGNGAGKPRRADLREEAAYFPQDPTLLFSADTVEDELPESDTLSEYGIDALEDIKNQSPFDISGGQQQLLALSKVLSSNARIVFLDEPTKGLDVMLRRKIRSVLKDECAKGRTIVVATHDLDLASQCADMAAMVFDGSTTPMVPMRSLLESDYLYTTTARRISSGIIDHATTVEEVVSACAAE